MHRGREKAVANTPHFTIIFTVFYFIQKKGRWNMFVFCSKKCGRIQAKERKFESVK